MNVTDALLTYLLDKLERPLPDAVRDQAKNCLLDYVGVTAAGNAAIRDRMRPYYESLPDGAVRIIGQGVITGGREAAFLNAFGAHVLELDDGHRFGMIHLAAPVQSAVLSAAQMYRLSGETVIKGIVMGYEAAVRLAVSVQPEHKKRGYHTAGTCGLIGAALGAAYALGADEKTLKSVLSTAAAGSAGLLEIQEDGSELKPCNVAHAAMYGLNAAILGMCDFCPPDDILGGARGWANILADGADTAKMTERTGYYEIERIYMKPYAACRHCHSAVEAALSIRAQTDVSPEEIVSVSVDTYGLAVRGHDHTRIEGVQSAKLSIPFSVAAALVTGGCGLEAFSETNVRDRRILSLTEKVRVREDPAFTAMSPARRIAGVRVEDASGRSWTSRVDFAKGDPENPLSDRELMEKFSELMSAAGMEDRAPEIARSIGALDLDRLWTCIF